MSEPATKQDLHELKNELVEAMRDMQTEVLRAFQNAARQTDVKMRSHEQRIALLEQRLYEIERSRLTQ